MHVLKANFHGSPNVGLFGYASGNILLIGEHLPEKLLKETREALGNPETHIARIAGTGLPGLFLAGNTTVTLVPSIASDKERETLAKLLDIKVVDTRHTCFGNTIVCNDHGAIVSTEYTEAEQKRIEAALGLPTVRMDIAGLNTPGAVLVLNGDKGIVHRDATEEEIATIERTLKITLSPATANLGTPYLKAAILRNAHGFVIGDASGGPEIVHIDDALGYA